MRLLFLLLFLSFSVSAQYVIPKNIKTKIDFESKFYTLTQKDGLSSNYVLKSYKDKYGFLWIATDNGLNRYDGYEILVYKHKPYDSTSLADDFVYDIVEDKAGNLWVATKTALNLYDRKKDRFKRVYLPKSGFVLKIYPDEDSTLWILAQDFIYHFSPKQNKILYSLRIESILQNNYPFFYINKIDDSLLVMGGMRHNVVILNKKTLNYEFLNFYDVAYAFADSLKNLYLLQAHGKILVFSLKKHKVIDTLNYSSAYYLTFDRFNKKDFYLVGYWSGLLYSKNGKFYNCKHYEGDPNSFPSHSALHIFQDEDNNLFISTDNGLAIKRPKRDKFVHFRYLNFLNDQSFSFQSNYIQDIAIENDSIVWIASMSGLDRFNLKSHTNIHFSEPQIPSSYINKLYLKGDSLFLGFWVYNNGYAIFDIKKFKTIVDFKSPHWVNGFVNFDGHIEPVNWGYDNLDKSIENLKLAPYYYRRMFSFNSLFFFRKNFVFFDNKIFLSHKVFFDLKKDEFRAIFYPTKFYSSTFVKKALEQFDDFKGIYREILSFDKFNFKQTEKYTVVDNFIFDQNLNLYKLPINPFNSYLENNKVFGFRNNKICILDLKNKQIIKTLTFDFPINNIAIADDYLLIIGNYNFEVYQLSKEKFFLKLEVPFYIKDLIKQDEKQFMLATSDGLYIYKIGDKNFVRQSFEGEDLNTLVVVDDGFLFAFDDKIIYEKNNGQKIYFFVNQTSADSLLEPIKKMIYWGGDSVFVKGRFYFGIFSLSKHKFHWFLEENNYALQHNLAFSATNDHKNNIWIGFDNFKSANLDYLDIKSGKVYHFYTEVYDSNSLQGTQIYAIYEDSKGKIWIGSDVGIQILEDFDKKIFKKCTCNGFLPQVKCIIEDDFGNFWFATDNSLVKYDVKAKLMYSFFSNDGFYISAINCKKFSNGKLLFAGKNGLILVDPNNIIVDTSAPKIVFEKIMAKDSLFSNFLLDGDTLILPHRYNNFSINIVVLDLTNPEKIFFRYKLENFEKNWNSQNAFNPQIKYTNIPHGNYVLEVEAINNDLQKSKAKLYIIVKPAFYQTIGARILFVLLSILFVYGIVRWRTYYLEKRKKVLKQMVDERTKQIQTQAAVISQQNEELKTLLEEISQQRDQIKEQKNKLQLVLDELYKSMDYAQRLQNALFPNLSELKHYLEAFIFYIPKEKVSGDFYWWRQINENEVIVILADCTGHGVPGAFMTFLGISILEKIILNHKIYEPAKILNILRDEIINILKAKELSIFDGMDMAIVKYNKKQQKLTVSTANMPIFIISKGSELMQFEKVYSAEEVNIFKVNTNRMPVGYYPVQKSFEQKNIDLSQDTDFVLLTDGYSDQIGGEKQKKFKRERLYQLLVKIYKIKSFEEKFLIVKNQFYAWKRENPQTDDVSFLYLKPKN